MKKGRHYEEQAAGYLRAAGLQILERNFSCKVGEIDIVCSQGEQLVFVEVRFRSNPGYGSAAASINRAKQRKIIRAAQFYLQARREHGNRPCRFDVLAITATRPGKEVDVQWLKNAFITQAP
jgi:putative endonuclease